MTTYKINFDLDAYEATGLGYKVTCYHNGAMLWHRYCRTLGEAQEIARENAHIPTN